MLLKILNIFSLFLSFGLCETNVALEYYIEKIRDDYCVDYCANQCKVENVTDGNKTCTQTEHTVITDIYDIQVFTSNEILLTWKTNLIDLKHLKTLDSSKNLIKVRYFEIKFNKTVTADKYFRLVRYMEAFNLFEVDRLYTKNYYEYSVHVSSGPQSASLKCPEGNENASSIWYNYFFDKLEDICFECNGSFLIQNNTFQSSTHLKKITFFYLNFRNLNAKFFENFTNIKVLQFAGCHFDGQSFLSSAVLQNNLEALTFLDTDRINLTLIQNYQKLHIIIIDNELKSYYLQEMSRINHRAFICGTSHWLVATLCDFNIGIKDKPCPTECSCILNYPRMSFIINCRQKNLSEIPDLPIPIIGNASLYFNENDLSSLPNTSSMGYNNLRELYLSDNKLTEINIDQMPQNLTILDISYNNITSLDPKVAEFLMKRKDQTSLLQIGIFWKCNCNNKDLLDYLDLLRRRKTIVIETNEYDPQFIKRLHLTRSNKIENPVHYHHLEGPCPDNCTCCSNGSSEIQFLINCTNGSLKTFPKLPNYIIGYPLLLLDNNYIETLSIVSLRNSTLREIHIKNNNLIYLNFDQLPSNLKVLDIQQNKLTALDDKVTQTISNIETVHLSGNPWQCSCKFINFLEYLRRSHPIEYKVALRNCSGQEYCPDQCTCCKDENLRFVVDCTRKNFNKMPPIPLTANVTLLFGHNRLTSLNRSIEGIDQLKELHLDNNGITDLDYLPHNIKVLDIRNNSLWKLSNHFTNILSQKFKLSNLTLYISGNKWSCHCEDIHFFRFSKSFAGNIKDLCLTKCSDSTLFVNLEENDICPPKIPSYFFIFTSFILLTILLSFLQCYWNAIRMWLYEKNLFMKLTARLEMDIDAKYDCFLAYCHKDSHLVKEYVDKLEQGRNKLRLCFYERDWLAGEPIPDCICYSVENSKCTAIIMTNHFLNSVWGRLEFRLALHATSKDPKKRLIVIVYPGVENFDKLDGELQSYMKLNTYLMRSDGNFWNKLIYALPHKKVDKNETEMETETRENNVE